MHAWLSKSYMSIAIIFKDLYIMKKKEFNSKLTLRKRIISHLDQHKLQGGTGVTVTINITIKITKEVTQPLICTTKGVCTLYCETHGCSDDCPSETGC